MLSSGGARRGQGRLAAPPGKRRAPSLALVAAKRRPPPGILGAARRFVPHPAGRGGRDPWPQRAGKSTLLKILSRITAPTRGRIVVNGRVASLLEVGTGFHGDLTGRENIFLNGAILGMSKAEIRAKFDEIVAFAEVSKFLDTPVKRYSSGMYMRLAFAVAAHLEPEILIVDEVLAVGDAQFQKKCLGKMQEVSRTQGRTVLFVSHNLAAVLQLTTRAAVLDQGRLGFYGPSADAVAWYNQAAQTRSEVCFDVDTPARPLIGTQAVRIVALRFDRPAAVFGWAEDFVFILTLRVNDEVAEWRVRVTIFTQEGLPVGTTFGYGSAGLVPGSKVETRFSLARPRLAPGSYYCHVSAGRGDHRSQSVDYDTVLDTLAFAILPESSPEGLLSVWPRSWGQLVLPDLRGEPASVGGSGPP